MKKAILTILLLVNVLPLVMGQPGGGGPPGPGEPVPIPGIAILFAAGALLGVRTLVKRRKS